ncbi:MAG: glycogen debranching enzyme, partial [Deltaproteobacteria bacterium]|nr:glycogen debranching enzyme [Deltaproteobacteria bacterium]
EANGEDNRDGWDDNASWNCGVEGETPDREIRELRLRQQRNFIVTLALSQGVPMLASGDEIGKTQGGNNNAFVQDNATSWLDWDLDEERRELLDFARDVFAFRARHPVFRRRSFLKGVKVSGSELDKDIAWFHPEGREMTILDWQKPRAACVGLLLAGDALDWRDAQGNAVIDDSFLVLLNGSRSDVAFTLPSVEWGERWSLRIDTSRPRMVDDEEIVGGTTLTLAANGAMVLKRVLPGRGSWRPSRGALRAADPV